MSPCNKVEVVKHVQLDSGGSGAEVWKVSVDDWLCCAKIIQISANNLSDVEAFEKEIEILKDLPNHHHIARYSSCFLFFFLIFSQVSRLPEKRD